jgi:hypothetical protein
MKKTTILSRNPLARSALRSAFSLIPFFLVCFGLSHTVHAVSPTPDGGYPGGNTAEGGSGALFSLTSGSNNTALGSQTLYSLTTGKQNTATGAQALKNNGADNNTADGFQALVNNTIGLENTATGWRALFQNTSGEFNTADGSGALYKNTGGSRNTASGWQALYNNSTGSDNTAYGYGALIGGGNANTAVGSGALGESTSSNRNTAVGSGALSGNMGGGDNTATGAGALGCNFNGSGNTANGVNALIRCRPLSSGGGNNNTVMGANALSSGDSAELVHNNTVIGAQALPLQNGGNNNIAIGYRAGVNLIGGNNSIEIGSPGDPINGDENTIRIGDVQTRAFIAGIRGVATQNANAVPVLIDSAGQLGTMSSSQRYKHEIKPMDRASEAILALKPVTFEYKSDKTDTPQFGLIAEQVAKVNPDLIVRDEKGEIYSVRYDAVNAMLLNEFLKAHRKIEEQADAIAELKSGMDTLTTALKKQATEMQAMRAQLRMSKMPSQVVAR